MKWIVLVSAFIGPAHAADKALILNDQEQVAYRAILDAAIKANGLNTISRNAFVLSDKLDAAGVVTDQKNVPKDEPKKEGDQ